MNTPNLNSFTDPKPNLNIFSFFANLRIGIKLFTLIAISVVGLGIFATFAFYTMGTVQINSPLYQQLTQNQELVADILPPPAYIIESYLTTSLLLDVANNTDTASVNSLIQKISVLQNEYEARHTYWTKALAAGGSENTDLKQALLIDSYLPAQKFYEVVNNQLIPAVRAGRLDEANKIFYETLTPAYESHRSAIDRVVQLQRVQIQDKETATQSLINRSAIFLITLIIITALITIILGILIVRTVVTPVSQLVLTANQIAGGNLEVYALANTTDEIGMLARAFNSMIAQLKDSIRGLEQRVVERTTELEKETAELENVSGRMKKRAEQLQAVAQVGQAVTSIQDIEELLPQITSITSERLGFYHVGVFLLDKKKEFAVLSAANSEGGKRMLERGYKLQVGGVGIVGYVASQGRPRIALDTDVNAAFFNNPYLPDTHSEMALPLNTGSEIIGVLDVQSEQPAAFGPEDTELLTILANQVSIAIQNARRFQETQEAIQESETTIRQYLRKEWKGLIDDAQNPGYGFSDKGIRPLEVAIVTPNVLEATQSGQTSIAQEKSERRMAIPIKLRGQVIGVMHLQSASQRSWGKDIVDITQAIADRVALAIDNARLLESSQALATKERTIGEITSRIGASVNLRNVLQTAVEELGRVLPDSEIVLQIQSEDDKK